MTTIQAPLLTVERLRPRGCRGGAGLAEEGPQLREFSTEEDSVVVEQSVRWRRSSSGGRKSAARHHVAAVAEGAARRCCLYLHLDPFTQAQAILASAFARKDHSKAKATAYGVLQLGLILGLLLGLLLGVSLHTGSRLFTEDHGVLHHIYMATPILVAVVSIACMVTLASYSDFIGIWIALSIYMCLRMFAGLWRIGTASGPWAFLRS